jgi:hypothetical protein
MKLLRITAAVLLLVALLAGCSLPGASGNAVNFYYSRVTFAYGGEDAVILPEQRDITGHEGDLKYILSLYLMGPLDEDLTAVFPVTTRLVGIKQEGSSLSVHLTPIAKSLSEGEFSLACSCLTMTCMNLTPCTQVTVVSGERTFTLRAEDLLLFDDPIPTESQPEETE